MKLLSFVLFVSVSASALHVALGQSTEAAEWPTGSFNQQRDGWQRNETKLTADNAKNIRLLWKLKTRQQVDGHAIVSRAGDRRRRAHRPQA